jgi:hypothetical protein
MARKLNIVENQNAAASAAGCSVELVKLARKKNCPACLPGGRYDVPKLKKWIAEHADELKAAGDDLSLKDQKTNEEIRKLKIANDKAEGLTIPRLTVAQKHREILARVKDVTYAKLENEYPPLFSNDVVSNRTLGKKLADLIIGEFRELSGVWPE